MSDIGPLWSSCILLLLLFILIYLFEAFALNTVSSDHFLPYRTEINSLAMVNVNYIFLPVFPIQLSDPVIPEQL